MLYSTLQYYEGMLCNSGVPRTGCGIQVSHGLVELDGEHDLEVDNHFKMNKNSIQS